MPDIYVGKGIGQSLQHQNNLSAILHQLCAYGTCSRADLAKKTGLKSSTITNLVRELIHAGLVVEDGLLYGDKNRRAIGIRINSERFCTIGVVVGFWEYSILLQGLAAETYTHEVKRINFANSSLSLAQMIRTSIHNLLAEVDGKKRVLAVGIALPGIYDREDDCYAPRCSRELDQVEQMAQTIGEGLNIPVFLAKDAVASAYTQYIFHQETCRSLAYITVGDGIAAGLVINNQPVEGNHGMAGEIGQIVVDPTGRSCDCGGRGCLNAYCSWRSLRREVERASQNGAETVLEPGFTIADYRDALQMHDRLAEDKYAELCECVAVGAAYVVRQLDPELIVFGGEIVQLAPASMLNIVSDRLAQLLGSSCVARMRIEVDEMALDSRLVGVCTFAGQEAFRRL